MKRKFMDKVKYVLGIDDIDEIVEVTQMGDNVRAFPGKQEQKIEDNVANTGKILNMVPTIPHTITAHNPNYFEEATQIVEDLKKRKILIVNLRHLYGEERKKIFFFLNGAVYALDGNINKYSKDILILTPKDVEIDSAMRSEFISRGLTEW